jgi:putative lipoic acid-binding regulatory protein
LRIQCRAHTRPTSTDDAETARRGTAKQLATATIPAVSRDQLDALYRALTSHPMVKIVL